MFCRPIAKVFDLSLNRWTDGLLQISPLAATSEKPAYVKLSRQSTLAAGISIWGKSMFQEGIGGSSQSVGSVTVTKVKTRCRKRNLDSRAVHDET